MTGAPLLVFPVGNSQRATLRGGSMTPECQCASQGAFFCTVNFFRVNNEFFCCVNNHLLVQDLYSMSPLFFFVKTSSRSPPTDVEAGEAFWLASECVAKLSSDVEEAGYLTQAAAAYLSVSPLGMHIKTPQAERANSARSCTLLFFCPQCHLQELHDLLHCKRRCLFLVVHPLSAQQLPEHHFWKRLFNSLVQLLFELLC